MLLFYDFKSHFDYNTMIRYKNLVVLKSSTWNYTKTVINKSKSNIPLLFFRLGERPTMLLGELLPPLSENIIYIRCKTI